MGGECAGPGSGRWTGRWAERWLAAAERGATSTAAIAVAVAIVTLALGASRGPSLVRLGLVALALAPWLWRLARPIPDLVLAAGTLVPASALVWRGDQFAAMFVMLLLIRLAASGRRSRVALATAAGVVGVLLPMLTRNDIGWVYWSGGVAISLYGGWLFSVQWRLQEELLAARSELGHQALLEQRQRIARDVHDLVAHSMTVVMLHLTAARLALQRDPAEAAATLAETERLGRQALTEVRRVVEVLRADDAAPDGAPLPGVDDLPGLVSRLGAAGMAVELEMAGDRARLSPSTGLALFRIAQEALSNAARHAPGARVQVRLDVLDGEARLAVRDWSEPAAGGVGAAAAGHGVAGMRERAMLVGGTLRAGPADPGWLVECVIPA